jgi:hypothetical protein
MKSLPARPPSAKAQKPPLEARLGPSVPGCHTLFLHRGAECSGYYVRRLPSDFGLAFGLDKFGCQGGGSYDVLLDLEEGHHSCECKGHLRWGTYCWHIRGLLQLLEQGKLGHLTPDHGGCHG